MSAAANETNGESRQQPPLSYIESEIARRREAERVSRDRSALAFLAESQKCEAEWKRLGMPGVVKIVQDFPNLIDIHVPAWGRCVRFGSWSPPEATSPYANGVGSTDDGQVAVLRALERSIISLGPLGEEFKPAPQADLERTETEQGDVDSSSIGERELEPVGYRVWREPLPMDLPVLGPMDLTVDVDSHLAAKIEGLSPIRRVLGRVLLWAFRRLVEVGRIHLHVSQGPAREGSRT